jgi:hypothetical protein
MFPYKKKSNDGLQLRRAISIQAEETKLLEKHAIAPAAARLCWAARDKQHVYYSCLQQPSSYS